MKSIEMDVEKLKLMTQTRVDEVLFQQSIYNSRTNWDEVEHEVELAVTELELERLVKPWRDLGVALHETVKTLASFYEAFHEGFSQGEVPGK